MPRTQRTAAARWVGACLALLASATACVRPVRDERRPSGALVLAAQGSFAVGGTVVTSPGTFDAAHPSTAGATLHGDHAYVFYQVPVDARPLPLVFWHGAGQSKRTWETTADGRFTFSTVECLGSCGTAPVMMVNEAYHESMSPAKVDALLKELP